MSSFVVHDTIPLLATASRVQHVKVFQQSGTLLHHYKHNANLFDEAMAPASALAFSPVQPLLAVATFGKVITIYSPPGYSQYV
jgi:hypothetical protein